jgi:hypothetical protein
VLIRWEHRDAMDPSTLPEIDVAQIDTTDISCM